VNEIEEQGCRDSGLHAIAERLKTGPADAPVIPRPAEELFER